MLALSGDRPVLIGESRWQSGELTERDLADLRRKAGYLPVAATPETTYAFWSRGGPSEALARHPDVRAYTTADLVG